MPWVILDREGSLRIGDLKLKPGANEVDDPEVLEKVRGGRYKGVTVQETREQEPHDPGPDPDAAPPPEVPEEPYERFKGRDGRWYYHRPAGAGQPVVQSEGFDTEEQVDAAIQADQEEASRIAKAEDVDTSLEAGPLLPSELQDATFECRADGCKKEFRSTGARRNHERIFHRGLSGDGEQ